VRIELFDDEVESIQLFDPLTGRIRQKVPRFTVYPSSHYVTPRQTVLNAIETIKVELKGRLEELIAAGKLVEAQRLEQRTRFDLEMLGELGFCKGIENYTRHLSGAMPGEPPPTLIDYLPADALMIVDESHVTIPQLGGMYAATARARKRWSSTASACLRRWTTGRCASTSSSARCAAAFSSRPRRRPSSCSAPRRWSSRWCGRPGWWTRRSRCGRPHSGRRRAGRDRRRVAVNERVLITTLTKRMAEDLTAFLAEHGVKVRYLHSDVDTVERSRSSATCAPARSTCWSASTCCARGSTCPRCRWWRSSTPTRKGSCVPSAR